MRQEPRFPERTRQQDNQKAEGSTDTPAAEKQYVALKDLKGGDAVMIEGERRIVRSNTADTPGMKKLIFIPKEGSGLVMNYSVHDNTMVEIAPSRQAPRLTRDQKRAQKETLKQEALKFPFVTGIIEFDRNLTEQLEKEVGLFAAKHAEDKQFQRDIVEWLYLLLDFLETPAMTDNFGDSPDDHRRRQSAFRTLSADMNEYFENLKISRNLLGTPLTLFAEKRFTAAYQPQHAEDRALLKDLADEARLLRTEIQEKLNRETTTPLNQKLELVHRTEDFVVRGIRSVIKAYS